MKTDLSEQGEAVKATFSRFQKIQLGIIFALYLLVGLNSGGFGIILPAFSATYQLDKSALGVVFVAVSGGYLIAALVSSWMAERLGLYFFILVGLIVSGIGSLALSLQPPLVVAVVARGLLGLAGAVLETGGNFYVAAMPRNTAFAQLFARLFGGGALFGPVVASGVLENNWGWNNLYFIWLILTVLLGIAFHFAFSHFSFSPSQVKPAPGSTKASATSGNASRSMRVALKLPAIWLASIFLLVYVGVETTVGSWSYTFLTEGQHLSTGLAGGLVSVYWLGLTLGRFGLGALIGRLKLPDKDRLLLMSCIIISLLGAVLVWVGQDQVWLAGLGLFLIGFSYGPIYPTTLAILSRTVAPELVSSGIALITGLSILGVTVFPGIAGPLLEIWGLGILFPYIIGLTGVMLVLGAVLLRPPAKVL